MCLFDRFQLSVLSLNVLEIFCQFSSSCISFSMRPLYLSGWFYVADWTRPLCYISVGVYFHIRFNYFSYFEKSYNSFHTSFPRFPFLVCIYCKFLKIQDDFLDSLSSVGFVSTIFLHVVWVFSATLFTCQMSFVDLCVHIFWYLKHLMRGVCITLLFRYKIQNFILLRIMDLLYIKMHMLACICRHAPFLGYPFVVHNLFLS